MRKWTKYFISNCQLHNSSGDSFGLFRQLLTDDQHRVGQFGPSPLGRLMCGTCKFVFATAANSDLLPQGICIQLVMAQRSTKKSLQRYRRMRMNFGSIRFRGRFCRNTLSRRTTSMIFYYGPNDTFSQQLYLLKYQS